MAAAVRRESADHYRVRFDELARRAARGPTGRRASASARRRALTPFLGARRDGIVAIDPYLVACAIADVMKDCSFRTARGRRLLWNEYRVVLARTDFELLRALQGPLERDLVEALASEAAASGAELVGELRINVVFDEGEELRPGDGVIRVGFVPTRQLADVRTGELTVRIDAVRLTGMMRAIGSSETVIVQDELAAGDAGGLALRWPGGEAALAPGATSVAGRPHDGAPSRFVALTGASARINKQHVWLAPTGDGVRIGRFPGANPVHVNGAPVAAGADVSVVAPAEVTLSRGELVLTVARS